MCVHVLKVFIEVYIPSEKYTNDKFGGFSQDDHLAYNQVLAQGKAEHTHYHLSSSFSQSLPLPKGNTC